MERLAPCVATIGAVAFVSTVNVWMAAALTVCAGIVIFVMSRCSGRKPLHHDFVNNAAAVDGEMIDVIAQTADGRGFLRRAVNTPDSIHLFSTKCSHVAVASCIWKSCGSSTP